MSEDNNVERKISNEVQDRHELNLRESGIRASEAGREERKRFEYYVDLWRRIKGQWKEKKLSQDRYMSFNNFYAIMQVLTDKPQRIEEIKENCGFIWTNTTIAKTLRGLSLLGYIKASRDLTNTRFAVYWIDKEEEDEKPIRKD